MASVVREFNFWPRCRLLNTWYSAADWQSINDVTYWHENTMGSGPHPIIPADYMSGIIVPFDGFVNELNFWCVPDNNNNSSTYIYLYKYSLLDSGPATQVSQPVIVNGSSDPFSVTDSSIYNPTVSKGDCLLLFAKEIGAKNAEPHIVGNFIITDW